MSEQKKDKIQKSPASGSTTSSTTVNKPAKTSKTKKSGRKNKHLASPNGIAHVHSTLNNTIITITDMGGNTIAWSSSGVIGYKGSKKSTPYAAGIAANACASKAISMGLKSVVVKCNGIGKGKENAIRSLAAAGLVITEIADVTPLPHNGCKPPKKPR